MAGTHTAQIIPVLLDMDNALGIPVQDVDDGLALALALASPELHIAGITASACNCRVDAAVQNSLRMLDLAGRSDIPVSRGAAGPLRADREPHHTFLEAKSRGQDRVYWNNLVLPPVCSLQDTRPASRLIIDAVRMYPNKLVLVMLGALTNLAQAMLDAPDIVPLIREVVHMGGVFLSQPGERDCNWNTPDVPDEAWRNVLRFNTWYDPEATAVVLNSQIPLRLVSANVTVHTFLSLESVHRVRDAGGRYRTFLADAVEPWVVWSMERRGLPGAHMHDPLALAVVFAPDLCRFVSMRADTDAFLEGREWLLREDGGRQVQVAVDVASQRFEQLWEDRLCMFESAENAVC